MYCRSCGEKIDDQAKVCPKCGAAQYDDTPKTMECKHCHSIIDADCIICPKCGKQVRELESKAPSIVITNQNQNVNTNQVVGGFGKPINKWKAFFLCLFLGWLGAHKFYEGKTGMGILYIFTFGLFGFGWFFDTIAILLKSDPYFVY